MRCLIRSHLLVALGLSSMLVACGGDASSPNDLAMPVADLAMPADLATAADLATPPDLVPPADLVPAPDLTPTCTDKVKNGAETDIDCGGGCLPCGDGKGCGGANDCTSGVCSAGACAPPGCSDAVRNGDETDVDCGGAKCPKCGDGLACKGPADCTSGVCTGGRCVAPTCSDSVKNGGESDVDCGGQGQCPRCADGKACAGAPDCTSGVCTANACIAPTCSDKVKNGDESDVDCGGAKCGKCGDGKACGGAGDCQSGVCIAGRCAVAGCQDGVRNGAETDIDCGGGCPLCGDGKTCAAATDCASGVCTAGRCAAPTCTDNVRNGTESDVDCGGSCPKCAVGKACAADADCNASVCINKQCAPAASCAQLLGAHPTTTSGTYRITAGGATFDVYCDMTSSGGGWTLFGTIVSGGFDYPSIVSSRFGTAATTANALAAKPAGTIARMVITGARFQLDVAQAAASGAFTPSTDASSSSLGFDKVLAQQGATILLDKTKLDFFVTRSGYPYSCPAGGTLMQVYGGWGSTIDGYTYNQAPSTGCNNNNIGMIWIPVQNPSGCGYQVKNTMELGEHWSCANRSTGKIATKMQLYYR